MSRENKKLQSILTDLDNKAITKHQAYELILILFDDGENEVAVCPKCGGREVIKTDKGYKCAFTDCCYEWGKEK
ncbi:MAG: hypothetical protein WCT77_03615 [Bacteroidota bacterium]|jgi:hypothetical protein